jgi:hypothetical protein
MKDLASIIGGLKLRLNPWFLVGALNKLSAYQKNDNTFDNGTRYAEYLSGEIFKEISTQDAVVPVGDKGKLTSLDIGPPPL